MPGALNRAVVAPQSAAGGFAHVTRKLPSGCSRFRGVGPDGPALGPSPNVIVPGPRYLLHQTEMGAPAERRATMSALAGTGGRGAAPTIGVSLTGWLTRALTSAGAFTVGGSGSP